jgi:hypothetical protein
MSILISHREGTKVTDGSEATKLRIRVTTSRKQEVFVGPEIPNGRALGYSGTSAKDKHGNSWLYVNYHGIEGWIQEKHTSKSAANVHAVGGHVVGGHVVGGHVVGGHVVGGHVVGCRMTDELHHAALKASHGIPLSKHERELAKEQMRGFRQQQAQAELMARAQAQARGMHLLGALGGIGFIGF